MLSLLCHKNKMQSWRFSRKMEQKIKGHQTNVLIYQII